MRNMRGTVSDRDRDNRQKPRHRLKRMTTTMAVTDSVTEAMTMKRTQKITFDFVTVYLFREKIL